MEHQDRLVSICDCRANSLVSMGGFSLVPRLLGGPVTLCLPTMSLAFAAHRRSLAELSESATNGVYPSNESDVIFGSEKKTYQILSKSHFPLITGEINPIL